MTSEEKHVTLKLYRGSVPRLLINYKNKDELYEKFMKKVKRLGFPIGELYSFDCDNDRVSIENADDLMAAVENNYNVKVYITSPKKSTDPESCYNADCEKQEEDQQKIKNCGTPKKSASRNRSPSPLRARGRSWCEHRHDFCGDVEYPSYPMPWNYGLWNNPRYQTMPFYGLPRAYGMDLRGESKQKCRHDMFFEDSD